MTSAFWTPENEVLQRQVDFVDDDVTFEQIWDSSQKKDCVNWILKNNFTKVCLQFPDNYLSHSTKIENDLKEECKSSKLFILADTSYGSCCVDEIAAAHVDADALVHFGNACLSKTTRLPVFYVLPRLPFDIVKFDVKIQDLIKENSFGTLRVFFDIGYQYASGAVGEKYKNVDNILFEKYPDKNFDGKSKEDDDQNLCVFVGRGNQTFFNLSMSLKAKQWYIYDPPKDELVAKDAVAANWIRRRYFYIEKVKDAQAIGLVIATLTTDGYLDIVKHLQALARTHNIRTYIISIGRINPAKLANFMEIDCYVLIGCPFNNIYTSRDFYKPIVSVFEAEIALNPAWRTKFPELYVTDFRDILPEGKMHREVEGFAEDTADVSLITGKVRNGHQSEADNSDSNSLVERKNYQIMEQIGGGALENRTWRGLEQNLGRTEPAKIEKGISGIPINYSKD